ncbi:MAG TPA: hypothetical protein VGG20_23745, partial [Thermoanaerobaculia bacterium]
MVWSFEGRELVLADVSSHQLLRYRPDGSRLSVVGTPSSYTKEFKPTQVHATPEGFVVRSSAYDWIWLNRDFKATRSSTQGTPPRFSLINETWLGPNLAGFGSLRREDGSWTWGFIQVGLTPAPKILKVVKEVSYQSKGGDLALVLNTVSATAGESAYALQFDEPSYLLNLRTGQRLKAFPPGFERLPKLPKDEGQDSAGGRVRVADASTLPIALYGRGAFLYLLTREQQPQKKPLWRLHRIDPKKDVLVDSVVLPTTATYLELAPGPTSWAILEESRGASAMLK